MACINIDEVELLFDFIELNDYMCENYYCSIDKSAFARVVCNQVTLGNFLDDVIEYADNNDIDEITHVVGYPDICYYYDIKYRDRILEIDFFIDDLVLICEPQQQIVDPIDLEEVFKEPSVLEDKNTSISDESTARVLQMRKLGSYLKTIAASKMSDTKK